MGNSTITKEEFTLLQKQTNRVIENISKEIMKGNIEIKPIYSLKTKTATCKYCIYKGICGFNKKLNHYEYVGNKAKNTILEEFKKDQLDEN